MNIIDIQNVSREFIRPQDGAKTLALKDVSLSIKKGEFFCILGPSGCGKSTLLNLMSGFENQDTGKILIAGKEVESPNKKYLSVFQDYGLLPWRNVIDNVRLGIETDIVNKEEQDALANHYISLVGLGEVINKSVNELSGGMKQRVAIARALATKPEVLFMDEPFGALDEMTRLKLSKELLRIWEQEGVTIVFVTHNIDDAIYLGDRIAVMGDNPGHIKEILDVNIERPRDLTANSSDLIKKRIFELFGLT